MKFLFSLFNKKKEVVQQRSVHPESSTYVNLNQKDFELALRYAKGEMSVSTLCDELNLSKQGTGRYLKAYTFICNCFKKMIQNGILIEKGSGTLIEEYQVKKELEFCDLDHNKTITQEIKRPVGRPRIHPRVEKPVEQTPVEQQTLKRQYIPRKKVLNSERFTTLMEEKGLQFENLSKNAQLKIQKYNGIIQRLRFMPESKLKAINSMIKRANELENSIFKSVFYFTPEKYQRKLDYLKKCGFIKDKSKVDTVDESMFQKKKIALWKPEAESVLGKIKISKPPSKFMRRKYPNLIEYVRAYKPEYVK